MLPLPTLLLPSQAYMAPLPLDAPLKVRLSAGSIFSQGDQAPQLWKSLINGKIRSAGALMPAVRSMRKVSGRVAAITSTATTATTITISMSLTIRISVGFGDYFFACALAR